MHQALVAALLLLASACVPAHALSREEQDALRDLNLALLPPQWVSVMMPPTCQWPGVLCFPDLAETDLPSVQFLDLTRTPIRSTQNLVLPHTINNFAVLESLSLAGNGLTGSVTLNISTLLSLDLSNNGLFGSQTLTASLPNLLLLQNLSISKFQQRSVGATGYLPPICLLLQLRRLDASSIGATEPIPACDC